MSKNQPTILGRILLFIECKINLAGKLKPLIAFLIRLQIAAIFWASGVLKLPAGFLGIGKGNWDSTLLLFEYEHPVPFIPAELAAYMGTTFEILCPILLVFGLGSRFAATILLIMTAVIEFTYQHSIDHQLWALLLGVIIVYGPGCWSLDTWFKKKYEACEHCARHKGKVK